MRPPAARIAPQMKSWAELGDQAASEGPIDLADHGMRLQVPRLVGLVVDPLVATKEPQESTTLTPAEIIYQRRASRSWTMLDGPASATPAAPSGCRAPAITAGRGARNAMG